MLAADAEMHHIGWNASQLAAGLALLLMGRNGRDGCHALDAAQIGGPPDALQPIEPPPIGDCTLAQARSVLGDRMILIGNIEYSDLAAREASEIDKAVADAITAGGPESFILCPSCSPYEEQISERTAENYITMIKAGLKYGRLAAGRYLNDRK